MGSRNKNECVRLVLTPAEMDVVDMLRQHTRSRTGKLPMRARAIADLIRDAGRSIPMVPTELRTYAALIAAVDSHSERLDAIEAAEAAESE